MKILTFTTLLLLFTGGSFAQSKDTLSANTKDTLASTRTKSSGIQRATSNGSVGTLIITTGSGTTEIGAQNSNFNHINTSLPRHYFNKGLTVNGTIASYDTQDLVFQTGLINRLFIKNNGNVGIGKDPGTDAQFVVYGKENPCIKLMSDQTNLTLGIASCDWCGAMGSKKGDAIFRQMGSVDGHQGIIFNIPNSFGDGKSYVKFGDDKNGCWFSIYTDKTSRVDGKIIIKELFANTDVNSNDPTSNWFAVKQDKTVRVDGTLFAKEINVKTDVWSDFVFDKTYKLQSLPELEAFINANKHLPDVPSETEAKENGVDVAEMNAILLQKVEELTLHILNLNKQLQDVKQQVEQLRK